MIPLVHYKYKQDYVETADGTLSRVTNPASQRSSRGGRSQSRARAAGAPDGAIQMHKSLTA